MTGIVELDAATAARSQGAVAGWLTDHGLRRGDRVAVDHDGSAAYLAVVIGALRIGVIPVPVPDSLPSDDREYLVADADVAARVGPADWEAVLAHTPASLGPLPLGRPMLYTSGTTGRRKGVWSGVWDADTARLAYLDEHDQWGFRPDDRHLVCSPLYHSAPLRFATHTLLAGGTVLLQGRFDAELTTNLIAAGRVTTSFVVPAHLQRIIDIDPPEPSDRLRWLAHAGSACPAPLKRRVIEWVGAERLFEFYGSSEAQFTVCRADEWERVPETVGRARRGRALLVDDDGVIWCRQPAFARFEYWRDPDKTAAAWRDDECTVGDLGALDDGGRLMLRGRRDDLVVSGGVNVYPAEVERVMSGYPGVDNCVAFGVDDDDWGQIVVLAWVGSADADELRTYGADHLQPAARPRRWWPLPSFPEGTLGKVSRRALAERYRHQDRASGLPDS